MNPRDSLAQDVLVSGDRHRNPPVEIGYTLSAPMYQQSSLKMSGFSWIQGGDVLNQDLPLREKNPEPACHEAALEPGSKEGSCCCDLPFVDSNRDCLLALRGSLPGWPAEKENPGIK